MSHLKTFFPEDFHFNSVDVVDSIVPAEPAYSIIHFPTRPENRAKKLLPLERIKHVFDNCRSLNRLAVEAKDTVLGHEKGFALAWLALQFDGGREWISANMKGWDQNQSDIRELDQSERRGYSSFTCTTMQERGLCSLGHPEACLKRKFRNGIATDPNPIRFAYGNGSNKGELLNAILAEIRRKS